MEQQPSKEFTGFPYESRYLQIGEDSIHYIEEGHGDPILLIHGNPTSCYLWRNIISHLAGMGKRVIAIDLLGFGLSSKPTDEYTIGRHYSVIEGFIEQLELSNLTIVGHDWGGPLAVRFCIDHLNIVNRIIVIDTFLWNLEWSDFPKNVKLPFKLMRSPLGYLMIQVMNGFVKQFVPQNILRKEKVTPELMANYQFPFPTISSRRAIRYFPKLIPVNGKPKASFEFFKFIEENIYKIDQPMLMILATPGMGEVDMRKVRNLEKLLPHFSYQYIAKSGHYIQEDQPEVLSEVMMEFIGTSKPK